MAMHATGVKIQDRACQAARCGRSAAIQGMEFGTEWQQNRVAHQQSPRAHLKETSKTASVRSKKHEVVVGMSPASLSGCCSAKPFSADGFAGPDSWRLGHCRLLVFSILFMRWDLSDAF